MQQRTSEICKVTIKRQKKKNIHVRGGRTLFIRSTLEKFRSRVQCLSENIEETTKYGGLTKVG